MANNNNNFYRGSQFPGFYNNTVPNGCRLCNQVFSSTQALLTHVESHMAQEVVALNQLYSSPQHVNNPQHQFPQPATMGDGGGSFQAQSSQPMGIMMPQPISRNHPFFNSSQIGGSSSSSSSMPIRQMQVPPQVFPYAGSSSRLEIPIKKVDFIDLVNVDDDDNNSEPEEMDLDLKL